MSNLAIIVFADRLGAYNRLRCGCGDDNGILRVQRGKRCRVAFVVSLNPLGVSASTIALAFCAVAGAANTTTSTMVEAVICIFMTYTPKLFFSLL
jgi:hypothetical protein